MKKADFEKYSIDERRSIALVQMWIYHFGEKKGPVGPVKRAGKAYNLRLENHGEVWTVLTTEEYTAHLRSKTEMHLAPHFAKYDKALSELFSDPDVLAKQQTKLINFHHSVTKAGVKELEKKTLKYRFPMKAGAPYMVLTQVEGPSK